MAQLLKQSTQTNVRVGPFVDATNGVTPETGVTLSSADQAELLKEGSGATVDISGATWAAITGVGGWYDLTLTTSHTDTLGKLVVIVQDESVCLPVWKEYMVVPANVYDSLVSGTDLLDVNTSQLGGTAYATALAAEVDAVHDEVIEGSTTLRQMMRGFAAALMGKASGLGTTTAVYRDIGDTKDRITATVDSSGNRTVVTKDLT
jgi:hypothetical protein